MLKWSLGQGEDRKDTVLVASNISIDSSRQARFGAPTLIRDAVVVYAGEGPISNKSAASLKINAIRISDRICAYFLSLNGFFPIISVLKRGRSVISNLFFVKVGLLLKA